MSAVFVSATGTDVGKTFVTCGLIAHFRAQGGAVEAIKPVLSGFDPAALPASRAAASLAGIAAGSNPESTGLMASTALPCARK